MKQASLIAVMASVAAAHGIHHHHAPHVHEKREDVVTKVHTVYEPHYAIETVWVDQSGKPIDGPKGGDASDSYKAAAGGQPEPKKKDAAKDVEAKAYEPPQPQPVQYNPPQEPKRQPPPKKQPQQQPQRQPQKQPQKQASRPKSPEEIQQGYIDQQQDLIDKQEAVNAQQPGVGGSAPQSSPQQQAQQPAPAQEQPAPQPDSYQPPPSDSQPPAGGEGMKKGQVTYYAAGLGSCGDTNGNSDHIVALSHTYMDSGKNEYCGKSLKISGPGGTYTAKVADTCPGCDATHLDLPEGFFMKVTNGDKAAGVVPVKWSFM